MRCQTLRARVFDEGGYISPYAPRCWNEAPDTSRKGLRRRRLHLAVRSQAARCAPDCCEVSGTSFRRGQDDHSVNAMETSFRPLRTNERGDFGEAPRAVLSWAR